MTVKLNVVKVRMTLVFVLFFGYVATSIGQNQLKASLSFGKSDADSAKTKSAHSDDDILVKYSFTRLADVPKDVTQKFGSLGLSVSFFAVQKVKNSGLSFAEGLGFSSNNYKNNVGNWQTDSITVAGVTKSPFTLLPDSVYKTNKIVLTTVDLPLEIRYTFKSKNSGNEFRIATGITLSYALGLSRKVQNDDGFTYKEKKSTDLKNIESFRYAYTARMNYGKFGVHFSYDLLPLFNKSNAQITPFAFGLVYTP